jgi:hypothetical protein
VVHLTTRIALLPLVALRGLVPIPHLLYLLVLQWGVRSSPLGAIIGIVANLPTLVATIAHGGYEVRWVSWACQPESSDSSARRRGANSTVLGVGTTGRSTETAGTGTTVGAVVHNSQSGFLDETTRPSVM